MTDQEKIVSPSEYDAISSKRGQHTKQVTVSSRSVLTIVGVLVLCGLSFWGGTAYQKQSTKSSAATVFGTQGGMTGGPGFARRGGGVGVVTSVTTNSITLNNQRSSSVETYTVSSSTTISNDGEAVALSDIKAGDTVMIMTSGSTSKEATSILVNPSFGGQPDSQSTDSL